MYKALFHPMTHDFIVKSKRFCNISFEINMLKPKYIDSHISLYALTQKTHIYRITIVNTPNNQFHAEPRLIKEIRVLNFRFCRRGTKKGKQTILVHERRRFIILKDIILKM